MYNVGKITPAGPATLKKGIMTTVPKATPFYKRIPTWGYAAGAGVLLGIVYLATRK